MQKVNFNENTLTYLNQAYVTVTKKKRKTFYCDYFILRQIVKASNPPHDVVPYTLKECALKMVRPKYNIITGEFLGIPRQEVLLMRCSLIIGLIRKSQRSSILTTKKNPKFLALLSFNRHKLLVESREVESDKRSIYFFLPSITDRSEEIN